ncbi:Protein ssh4 [Microbotryomycetes sp. JL201]|nr:Protein ssh4 [Microbotryomycetes sp. JL201]
MAPQRVHQVVSGGGDAHMELVQLLKAARGPPMMPALPSTPQSSADQTAAVLLPLLVLLCTVLFLILVFLIFLLVIRRGRRTGAIALGDATGPTDLAREEDLEGEGGLAGIEQRWLESVDEQTRAGYLRAKVWQQQYAPNSEPTDITLSQFLSIQEKGVSAWSFEPDYESNPPLFVESRTELTFLADGVGMAPEEGGGCCVQSNLPIPKVNEVYYWECKLFDKPEGTNVAIGLATKPYPSFRLPGWNKFSVAYFSADGFKCHSYPFTAQSYGQPLAEGDVLGVGYRPRTGTVFFTRNGKKLEDAYLGLNKHNLFPTVGADSACSVHVNFGQAGFVFIEANVKKWGLAPMIGTLAPPPAYGSEGGSILLQTAAPNNAASSRSVAPPGTETRASSSRMSEPNQGRLSTTRQRSPALTQPIRPSPLRGEHRDHYHSVSSHSDEESETGDDEIHNPPTPGLLDISLHSMHRFPRRESDGSANGSESLFESLPEGEDLEQEGEAERAARSTTRSCRRSDGTQVQISTASSDVSPPAYHPVDPHMYAPGVAEAVLEDAFRLNPNSNPMGQAAAAYEATQVQSRLARRGGLLSSWFGASSSS